MLKPTDSVRVLVLVDNATDNLSSTPAFVETKWASYWRRGMRVLSGRCWCCAAHGLSCLIIVRSGETERTLLFDTGPEDWVFERDSGWISARSKRLCFLSHIDHAGGMPRALQMISLCNGGRSVPTYVHPGMFWPRAVKFPDGSLRVMEDIPSVLALNNNGAEVV